MKNFSEIVLSKEGKRFAILGGSRFLEDDVAQVKADVYISANEHGVKVRDCDYIVAMDTNHGNSREMGALLREHSSRPIISKNDYADYRVHSWPHSPRVMYSGLIAAWVAYAMGAKAVFLCGFDAYNQKAGAVRKAQMYVDHIRCEVREVGGRMGVWPAYKPKERFRYTRQPELETLRGDTGMTKVVAQKPTRLTCGPIEAGEERPVMRDDKLVQTLLKHGILREVA